MTLIDLLGRHLSARRLRMAREWLISCFTIFIARAGSACTQRFPVLLSAHFVIGRFFKGPQQVWMSTVYVGLGVSISRAMRAMGPRWMRRDDAVRRTRAIVMLALAMTAGLAAVFLAGRWLTQQSMMASQSAVVASWDIELGQLLAINLLDVVARPATVVPKDEAQC